MSRRTRRSLPEALEPKLWNDFHRITLVGVRRTERVTIDLGLSFEADARHTADLPGIVVAELKQHGVDRTSPFMHQMRAARVRPAGMSKYCVGVSLLTGTCSTTRSSPRCGRSRD